MLLAVGVAAVGVAAVGVAAVRAEAAKAPACVAFWPEARFRNYGHDHVVHLLSRCRVEVRCAVSSDVNPTPVEIALRPEEHVEVLTFRGSPAREFTPRVACRLP